MLCLYFERGKLHDVCWTKNLEHTPFNHEYVELQGWLVILVLVIIKDIINKIRNHACLIIVYNHPTSLRQDQSVAIANANFA